MNNAKTIITRLLLSADVRINGIRPWDIKVRDEQLYARLLSGGSLALGESYTDKWWDCDALDELFHHVLNAKLDTRITGLKSIIMPYLRAKLFNRQKSRAYHIGEWHYDIGNDLYTAMLDRNMQYSCAYWRNAETLDKAQEDKMELICKKLGLKEGERLLDIGCGWGGLLRYAAEKYGITGVGITVSKEQSRLAKENCKGLPLEIRIEDYRKLNGSFDKIVSVGMIEHVGYKNYREYMEVVRRCLTDQGIFLLHTIGANKTTRGAGDPWMDRYIFPDGKVPSAKQLANASEGLFVMEDWHNFGADYDKTLMAWRENFISAWPKLREQYGERFFRRWIYYLSSCAGGFRSRNSQLWQVVYTKKGQSGVYERPV